eukprot:1106_1
MTTIDKIALCGIRSYDPNGLVVIKFFKPLTIILGNNGCGKTTIIEALKYVCCGDVPPLSDRGKSFVHDPKHCGVNVVKAQVKVAFKTRDGKPVIVNSSMQLTQKRTKSEFKTIDGVVRMYDESTNEQIALSHKCADMKKVVPELMGVSRAILDNVIFCHQEDANWPLSEAKKLKEKFDQIFATSRWSKALINVNQFRKTLFSRSKDLKADLAVFLNNKEVAHKLTGQLEETKVRMAEYQEKSKAFLNEIEALKAELIPLREAQKKLRGFDAQKRVFENDINHFRKQQKDAHDRMQCEYEETDEELGVFLANHDAQIRTKENEMAVTSAKYDELKRELRNKQGELTELHVTRGKVSQIVEDLKHKKEDVQQRMVELNSKYAIDEMDMTRIISVLEGAERRKKEEIEKYHLSFLRRDETLEKEITESVAKRREFEYKSTHLKKQQNENETKRRSLNEKLQNIKRNQKECVAMKNEISELKLKVAQLNDGEDETRAMEEQITQCQRVQQENRDKMRELNEERRGLRDEAQQHTIFEVKKKQFETARENYNCRFASMKPKIVSVCDRMPSMKSLKREFREKNAALRSSFEGAQKEYNAQETQHSVCESKLSSIARDQERLQESLSGDVIRLSESSLSMDDNIGGLIDEAREAARSKQSEFALAKCGRTLYSKFNHLAKRKNECPVCQRRFANDGELQSFVKSNTSRIKNVEKSGAIEKHEKDANRARNKLQSLQNLVPIYQNAMKKRGELCEKEAEFEKQRNELKKCGEELEEMFARHIESKSLFDRATMLQSNVDELCREFSNVCLQEKEYKVALQAVSCSSTSKRRSLIDVENEYEALSKENNEKNALQSRLRREISEFDKKRRNANQRLMELERKHSNYNELNAQQKRIGEEVTTADEECKSFSIQMDQIRSQMQPLATRIRRKQKERSEERSVSQQKERKFHEYLRRFSNDIHHLSSKMAQFEAVQQRVDSERYASIAQDLEVKEREHGELQSKLNRIGEKKHELEKWLQNVAVDKADLLNNLSFRKFAKLVTAKKKELQQLKAEMNLICADSDNIGEKMNSIETAIAIKQSSVDQQKGGMESEKRVAVDVMRQLRGERYKQIDEKYRSQLIKYETTLIAHRDLDAFEKALDKSLIQFHSLKMKEINSVLKELWQQTYRGKDIDCIEIVSEVGATKKKKNYNYNVVMIQGDAALPMRGRCSAGQRVLAALLIRLALAETFCLNCGVLALDEPTTNLDAKNIEALAYALNQIISRRKRQHNFQLILITHDENFVEKLGQREHTDGYYRVFKNEFQHSKAKLYKFADASSHHKQQQT